MTLDEALDQIRAHADETRASGAAKYHKSKRLHLGTPNPVLNDLTKTWRQTLDLPARLDLAHALWGTDIFEARLAAAKLLTQARLRPDDTDAWSLIQSWVPDFDSWAIADHACMAGQRRLIADPSRVDTVETWATAPHMWTRRAAFVITLPWTKQNHPTPEDLAIRDRVLGWAAAQVDDHDWFIQKAIAWWLRDLSKHDPDRVRAFIDTHGSAMKPFARKEALRQLK